MIKEFKEFISRGNVLDLAVGVVIGSAFSAIINSLVEDIITPLVGMIIGGIDFSSLSVTVGNAELMYGNFIQAIINFLIIAFCLFLVVKAANSLRRKEEVVEEEVTTKTCPFCKSEIDIDAVRCPHCTSELSK